MTEFLDVRKDHLEADRLPRPVLDDFTVIIPSVGRPLLRRCLQSIVCGSVWPRAIVVVDQGDNPEVADWLRETAEAGLEIRHLISAERNPASARNAGIEAANTTFVAALDDDCVAESDWLGKMAFLLRDNSSSIVTGRLESAGAGIPPTLVTSKNPRLITRPSVVFSSPLASANMGFAVSVSRRIGPFDTALRAAEENDWAYRALRSGIPILYAPEAVVYHVPWRDRGEMAATYRLYARTQGEFFGKHLRRGDISMIPRLGLAWIRGGRSLLGGLLCGDHNRMSSGLAKLTLLLPGLVAGWRRGRFTR